MTTLRFRTRAVHNTIADYLVAKMTSAGWVSAPVNLGARPLNIIRFTPDTNDTSITPNVMAITLGNEPAEKVEQLGGGLSSIHYPLYVDVYGENQGITTSICNDAHDALFLQVIPIYDYSTDPRSAVPGSYVQFESVTGPFMPPQAEISATDSLRRFWRTLQADAWTFFSAWPAAKP